MVTAVVAISATILTVTGGTQAASPELAAELARLMNERQITAISAPDPAEPGRFVAAMLAGPQLLVIRARYPVPVVLRERILKGEHQQVYADLHGASDQDGRTFIMDSGADGLKLARESNDVAWRNGTTQAIFNMDWKTQKLKEADYRRTFDEDQKAYAEMLNTLIGAIKTASTASAQ
jgi:hypothetical protein